MMFIWTLFIWTQGNTNRLLANPNRCVATARTRAQFVPALSIPIEGLLQPP